MREPETSIPISTAGLPDEPARAAERIARRTVEAAFGAKVEPTDVRGGPPGMHDFDVHLDLNRVAAMEVTSVVDPVSAKFENAVATKVSPIWVPHLTRHWEIRVPTTTVLRTAESTIVPAVQALDASGANGFATTNPLDSQHPPYWKDAPADAPIEWALLAQQLIEAGVTTAWPGNPVDPDEDGAVFIMRESTGGPAESPSALTDVVSAAVESKTAVLSHPAAMTRAERWLFVWLDADHCRGLDFAQWVWRADQVPAPELPPPIDRAFLGCWSLTPGEGMGHALVWTAARDASWSVLKKRENRREAPEPAAVRRNAPPS